MELLITVARIGFDSAEEMRGGVRGFGMLFGGKMLIWDRDDEGDGVLWGGFRW